MLDKLIQQHPREIGETYGEHAGHALFIGVRMILAGLACLVHALLPGLFVRTASLAVQDIQDLMTKRTAPSPFEKTATVGERAV
jgi:hypothetical protein